MVTQFLPAKAAVPVLDMPGNIYIDGSNVCRMYLLWVREGLAA